uniref:Uncharacterized protein n=1 Tax=Oryza nivara TaxID=4536 RepID=A0A0E0I7W5_ORYNI
MGPPVREILFFSFSLLLPPVFFFLLFFFPCNSREKERRGAGAPMVERPRRRRPSVLPDNAHPGKWSPSEGERRPERQVEELLFGCKGGGYGGLMEWIGKRGKGKNGIISSRRTRWREGLACEALVREIERWH